MIKTLLLALALAPSLFAGEQFGTTIFTNNVRTTVRTSTVPVRLDGYFWTAWVVETNQTPQRATMERFPKPTEYWGTNGVMTNYWISGMIVATNSWFIDCNKEHLDRTDRVENYWVSSNLVAYLVWRGRTNVDYLESITFTNFQRTWHYDKTQVWTQ